jgi:hypothetical protein
MKTVLFLLVYNFGVETLRVCDVSYYTVKEIKIKKIEEQKRVFSSIVLRSAKC